MQRKREEKHEIETKEKRGDEGGEESDEGKGRKKRF
jgi:hypothetical protein